MINQAPTHRLSQERETPPQKKQRRHFAYRCAYFRSVESREFGDPGQDYLVIRDDERRVAFSLCDGVSQSFQGNLAARLLGDALVDWLWGQPITNEQANLAANLTRHLGHLTTSASEEINRAALPEELPPLLREVLEQQRTRGSESMFVAGLIETNLNRLALLWMGDSRIRLWGPDGERTKELGETFYTKERWSSHQGPIGQVHAFVTPLEGIHCLIAYSDGLALLDKRSECPPDDDQFLENLIAEAEKIPPDDDKTFLEITLAPTPKPLQKSPANRANSSNSWRIIVFRLTVVFSLIMSTCFFAPTGLSWLREVAFGPIATPSPVTVIASPTPTGTSTATASATVISTERTSATVTPTTTVSPTVIPTERASATATPTTTVSPTVIQTKRASATATFTPSPSPTQAPSPTTTAGVLEGTVDVASLRDGPCDSYQIVGDTSQNERVTLLFKNRGGCPDEDSYWYQIEIKRQHENGNEVIVKGWVAEHLLKITDETANAVPEVYTP